MVRLQRLAQRVHIMACISIICCAVAAHQSASAQAIGGVQIVWQKTMDRGADICALTAGGRWAMTATGTGTNVAKIRIRDMETGEVVNDLVGPVKLCMVFGKDSTTYMTLSEEQPFTISTISTRTGEVVESFVRPSFYGKISAVYPFSDRVRWVVSNEYGLFIYNTLTKQTDTFYLNTGFDFPLGNIGGATWIGLSDNETQIYTHGKANGRDDQPVRLCAWDVAKRELIYQKEESKSFVFGPVSNPRGRLIIGWIRSGGYPDGSKFELYDLRTGELVRYIPKLNPGIAGYFSLTHDGMILAYQTQTGTRFPIHFVDTETGVRIGEYNTKYDVGIIQFLQTTPLEAYLPTPDTFSLKLRINPTTSVQSDALDKALRCTVLPNPGDGYVAVSLTLAAPSSVILRLTGSDGMLVQEQDLGMMDTGTHTVPVRAASGYYQCTVTAGRAGSSFPIIIR